MVARRLFVLGMALIGLTGISTTLGAQSVGFAYVAHFGGVSAATIDATGALTRVAGSPFQTGMTPESVTVDSTGSFAYVAKTNSASISAYTIDRTTGVLTPVPGSSFPTGSSPLSVTTTAGPPR